MVGNRRNGGTDGRLSLSWYCITVCCNTRWRWGRGGIKLVIDVKALKLSDKIKSIVICMHINIYMCVSACVRENISLRCWLVKTSQQRLQIFIYFLDYCFPYGVTGLLEHLRLQIVGGGGCPLFDGCWGTPRLRPPQQPNLNLFSEMLRGVKTKPHRLAG